MHAIKFTVLVALVCAIASGAWTIPSAKAESILISGKSQNRLSAQTAAQRKKIATSLRRAGKKLQSTQRFQQAVEANDADAVVALFRSETGITEPMSWSITGCISCVGFKICFGGSQSAN